MSEDDAVREIERRKLNVWEALIVASLLGLGVLIFKTNDSVTALQATSQAQYEATNRQFMALQMQLSDVPSLAQRVSRNEARLESLEDSGRENRRHP